MNRDDLKEQGGNFQKYFKQKGPTLVMFYKQHCTGDTSLTFSIFESRYIVVP